MKWSELKPIEREDFARKAKQLVLKHPEIEYHSITVKKENVQTHIQSDPNKLYNYMIKLSLIDEMAKYPQITFIPDPRSVKVESGNSLHDFLATTLWFDKNVSTILITTPQDSQMSKNIQFADMLSGIVQNHFEDNNTEAFSILGPHITIKRLFF